MDKGRIYIRSSEHGILEPLEEEPFKLEEKLQTLIATHPELLDGRQMTSRNPRRWLLVTRDKGYRGHRRCRRSLGARPSTRRSGRGTDTGRGEARFEPGDSAQGYRTDAGICGARCADLDVR